MNRPDINEIDDYTHLTNLIKDCLENNEAIDYYSCEGFDIVFNTTLTLNPPGYLQNSNTVRYIELGVRKDNQDWTYLIEIDNDDNTFIGFIENEEVITNLMTEFEIEEE